MMSRKVRVWFAVSLLVSGALALAIIGIQWITKYPYLPYVGYLGIGAAVVFILIIPLVVRGVHRKMDEQEVMNDLIAERKRRSGR